MIVVAIRKSDSPGNEQTGYWTCDSAKQEGGDNLMGVCRPGGRRPGAPGRVGARIARIWWSRRTRSTGCCCRSWYVVPHWYLQSVRVAYWDRFGRPDKPVRTGVALRQLVDRPGQGRRHRRRPAATGHERGLRQGARADGRLPGPPPAAGDPDAVRHHRHQLRGRAVRARRPGGADDRRTEGARRRRDRPHDRRRRGGGDAGQQTAPIAAPAASIRT